MVLTLQAFLPLALVQYPAPTAPWIRAHDVVRAGDGGREPRSRACGRSTTRRLMEAFYPKLWVDGLGKAEALWEAK
jgi:hypothetical protein